MEYKKSAIRMPQSMWDELTEVAKRYGISNNSMMVLLVGQMLETERKKNQMMSPEGFGKIISQMTDQQLSLFGNNFDEPKK